MSEYVRKYASEEALRQAEATAVSSSSESSMSDFSEDEAQVKIIKFFSKNWPILCNKNLSDWANFLIFFERGDLLSGTSQLFIK